MSPELVEPTLRKTLQDLQLEYLDLYLIHWPMAYQENSGLLPLDSEGRVLIKEVDFVDTWKVISL
jgi:aldehyde reductase